VARRRGVAAEVAAGSLVATFSGWSEQQAAIRDEMALIGPAVTRF
jgi:hypothetical protein